METSAEAEQRLALAMEAAQLGAWTWDMAAGVSTWDTRLEEMHGLRPGEFGGTFEDWVAALHPDDRAECLARVERALADPGPYLLLHRTTWPDGSVHTIECRGTVLVDADGAPRGTTGVAIDVTARERHQAAVRDELVHEREVVQALQRALLPRALPQVPGATIAARYRAAEVEVGVGGDWYAVVALPDGRLSVAVGDVTGHGIDAVAEMAAARFSLRTLALTDPRPEVVFERLNQTVKTFDNEKMITALYGVLDPKNRTWTYVNAGHMPAILRPPSGGSCFLDEPRSLPLGFADSFQTCAIDLPKGASLLLFTDGLIERRGESIAESMGRLLKASDDAPSGAEVLADHVLARTLENNPAEDDVALLAISLD